MNIRYKSLTIRDATSADSVQLAAWWNSGRIMAHAGFPNGLKTTAEKIAEICNISIQAAKHRAERMAILEARNKYYLHPLERQVRKQFEDYIKENRSQSHNL